MGFRFTLEAANIVANLTCGRIYSCYDGIYDSYENYEGFLYFLSGFAENMYSSRRGAIQRDVKNIQDRIRAIGYHEKEVSLDYNYEQYDKVILHDLKHLSHIFNKCRVKSLLLPRLRENKSAYIDDFMTSERILHKLLHWHSGDSCLILQPQDRPIRNTVTIFDAFPHFEVALKQVDLWPAVLFWDGEDFAFVPVRSESELMELYEILYFEQNPIYQLKRYANMKKESSHYYFHLSDLHFGVKNIEVSKRRLKSLIRTQLSVLDVDDKIDFIVTGDAVNSPSKVNKVEYDEFSEFLESKSGEQPIFVLGNHDVNKSGLAFNRNNQMLVDIVGGYPQIKIVEDTNAIFLLFNSNTNGNFAEGEIGQAQMAEMGNILDKIPKLRKYRLVAVLHHHVVPVKKPEFYDERWYKKIIPKGFLENSLRLLDADLFLAWMKKRNVKLVLHGHKHIPFISEYEGMHIISCGSSTGQIAHKDRRKTYLSYNVLKFTKDSIICSQFAEELLGAGVKDIRSIVIDC